MNHRTQHTISCTSRGVTPRPQCSHPPHTTYHPVREGRAREAFCESMIMPSVEVQLDAVRGDTNKGFCSPSFDGGSAKRGHSFPPPTIFFSDTERDGKDIYVTTSL